MSTADMRPAVRRYVYLAPAALYALNFACWPIRLAFDACPYLVGSATERADYRDVDVRTILDDDRFAAMFPGYVEEWTDPLWSLVCSSISRQLSAATGLVVDYQIQSMSVANGPEYKGRVRNALALFAGAGARPGSCDPLSSTTGKESWTW